MKEKGIITIISTKIMPHEITELLSHLVQIDTSINPEMGIFPSSSCRDFLGEYASKNGFEVYTPEANHKGNPVYPLVLVKRGKKPGKTVLFLGHLDVVPVSDEELPKWDTNPFEPQIIDGYLMGRGASDMKGGVVAFVVAFKEKEINSGNLIIALSGDEEVGGIGSLPPIIDILENLKLIPDYVINAEPSKDQILVTQRRGATWLQFDFLYNKAMTKGLLRKKEFFSIQGDRSQTLHSAFFLFGSDVHAMFAAAKFCVDKKIVSVKSSSIKTNAVPYKVSVEYVQSKDDGDEITYSPNLTQVMSNLASVGSLDWPVKDSKYGISVNPNMLSIDSSDQASLVFDIRAMHRNKKSHDELLCTLKNHLSKGGVEVEGKVLSLINPVDVSPNSFLPKIVAKVCKKYGYVLNAIGEKLGGASDTRFFTEKGIPGVELGPIGKNEHGTNEGVNLSSLQTLVQIFQSIYDMIQDESP